MRYLTIIILTGLLLFGGAATAVAEPHQAGVGIHYWFTLDDIDAQEDFDEDGFNWVFSYKYQNSPIGFIADLEVADQEIAGESDLVLSPQVFVIAGSFLYGGLGVGVHYTDSNFSDPFFALRAGLNMEIIEEFLYVDVNLNYRFDNWDYDAVQEDVDTDTVTLGITARIGF